MKTHMKIILLLVCLGISPGLYAQVTIGIDEAPAEGALLQLKDIKDAISNGGKNADKGLLMPRVRLVNNTQLDPMFPNATEGNKKEHAGLIVYNLTEDESKFLKKGIMVWNGQEWNLLNVRKKEKEDMSVKKKLYRGTIANASEFVTIDSLQVSMKKTTLIDRPSYYTIPQIARVPPLAYLETRAYSYQATQYWHKDDGNGYSNDVISFNFNYIMDPKPFFIGNDMSPDERNEVWMIDDTTNEVYHINFFTLGENNATADKIFAILAERF
jgi:hypothetical protein